MISTICQPSGIKNPPLLFPPTVGTFSINKDKKKGTGQFLTFDNR